MENKVVLMSETIGDDRVKATGFKVNGKEYTIVSRTSVLIAGDTFFTKPEGTESLFVISPSLNYISEFVLYDDGTCKHYYGSRMYYQSTSAVKRLNDLADEITFRRREGLIQSKMLSGEYLNIKELNVKIRLEGDEAYVKFYN